jgi:beta-galactosidase
LRVVGYDAAGAPVCEDQRVTAGNPAALRLTPITDPTGWKADGHDLALFEVEVVDDQGRRCPTALNLVDFTLSGPAEWRGGIGVRSDTDPDDNYILSTSLPVECGVNRVFVRSATNAGPVALTASSAGLLSAATNVNTVPFAVTNGLANWLPGEGLPANYSRGPTPAGPSYQVSRVPVPVASITAGANSSTATNAVDDNEGTSWTSGSSLSTSWIQFTLARTSVLSQIVWKYTQTPRDDLYPLAIQINGTNVYAGTPPATLGYVTLNLPPVSGNTVRLSRTNSGSFPLMEIEFYEPPAVGRPVIETAALETRGLVLGGSGGTAQRVYYVLSSADPAAPSAQWTRTATNAFDFIGRFSFTNPAGTAPRMFHRLQVP